VSVSESASGSCRSALGPWHTAVVQDRVSVQAKTSRASHATRPDPIRRRAGNRFKAGGSGAMKPRAPVSHERAVEDARRIALLKAGRDSLRGKSPGTTTESHQVFVEITVWVHPWDSAIEDRKRSWSAGLFCVMRPDMAWM